MLAPRTWPMRKIRSGTSGELDLAFDPGEHREQGSAEAEQADGLGRAPSGIPGVDQRIQNGDQAARDQGAPGVVDGAIGRLGPGLADQDRGQCRGAQGDRDVDEQHPPPAQRAGQHAAEDQPDNAARTGHRRPDPQGPAPFGALLEQGHDDGAGGRGQHGRAGALQARKAISSPICVDSPPASEASPKRTRPPMNSRLRPKRSARRPPSISSPPKVRM